jgi:hypothetical protein
MNFAAYLKDEGFAIEVPHPIESIIDEIQWRLKSHSSAELGLD